MRLNPVKATSRPKSGAAQRRAERRARGSVAPVISVVWPEGMDCWPGTVVRGAKNSPAPGRGLPMSILSPWTASTATASWTAT
jgi:hypothetical protein